ncbi:MAG: TetR/AcrR family transcriptional regulator, partial [Oscillospiraceae bacterium]
MYEPKNQRRTLTKRLLKESLMKLLKEKDIQKISITELCQDAGINRTTFYSHYGNQYDVLKDMENTMIQDVQAIMDRHLYNDEWDERYLLETIETVCDYLKENLEVAKAVLRNNGIESEFASTLLQLPAASRFARMYLSEHYDDIDRELLMICYSKGWYSLIRQWLVYDLPKSSKEIAGLIYEIATKGWMIPSG